MNFFLALTGIFRILLGSLRNAFVEGCGLQEFPKPSLDMEIVSVNFQNLLRQYFFADGN